MISLSTLQPVSSAYVRIMIMCQGISSELRLVNGADTVKQHGYFNNQCQFQCFPTIFSSQNELQPVKPERGVSGKIWHSIDSCCFSSRNIRKQMLLVRFLTQQSYQGFRVVCMSIWNRKFGEANLNRCDWS